jgi:hypothetical protein
MRSPCVWARELFDAEVLITPHGFQSMLLLFMKKSSILFEVRIVMIIERVESTAAVQIFPFKYYKRGYGPLSTEFGELCELSDHQ